MSDKLSMRPGRIAVVEDNRLERTYLTDLLVEEDHLVEAFSRAEHLFDAPQRDDFDVVVTDLVMEGMGGQQLIEQLRDAGSMVDVVVVTMLADADSAVRAMRAGAFDYLVKPVNSDVLKMTVARCLEKHRLLEQNLRLRRDLELALAGQRILASPSPDRIAETALAALLRYLDMDAGLVEAGGTALSILNLSAAQAEIALALVGEHGGETLQPVGAQATLPGHDAAYVVAMGQGEAALRALVARAGRADAPDEADVADATFLLRHAHHALVNERIYARARDEALRDSLTGLFNARYLEDAVKRAIESGQFEESCFALLFLDIDHFKQVNDTHGHLVGSKLLVELGKVLRRCVRENDAVARFGGDEFVVLLEHANVEGAQVVAERIRTTVERRPFLSREGPGLHVTVCVGIACYPAHGRETRHLFELADTAMYDGKRSSRNIVNLARVDMSTVRT
ncbi:MAG: diguanylate cyclase [Pseudomonadota bacterium]